jgi:hypothetical protein
MLNPILPVYSTKRAAFSASFLATSSPVLPVCQMLVIRVDDVFILPDPEEFRMIKRIGPSIDPWQTP